jgi:signal transduction histidine kinase
LFRSLGVFAIILIASSAVALLLADRAQRVVSEPILELAKMARQVSRTRDYSLRPAEVQEDELGQLSDAFRYMLAKVQRREQELRRSAETLRMRERFLSRLSEVSQQLLRGEDPRLVLPHVMLELGEISDASHCCMVTNSRDERGRLCATLAHGWSASDAPVPLSAEALRERPWNGQGFGSWRETLAAGGVVSGVSDSFAPATAAALRAAGVRSVLALPITVFASWHGALAFADCRRDREWQKVEVDLLSVAAAEIGAALENAELMDQLRREAAKLEERVVERTAELEAVNRELKAFSYSVSHDLRAPLRSIDGFAQALVDEFSDRLERDGVSYLERIRQASQRMGRLIDGLLSLSRLTRRKLHVELVDVSSLARRVGDELLAQNGHRTVQFSVHDGLEVYADPDLLRVVLENLVGNAWKFTAGEQLARIEVGAKDSHRGRIYWVKDNGTGFDMEYVHRLFGAFQRLHSAADFDGNGIGLATVQRIIHRHGGRVWAEGIVGEGACFYFSM